LAADVHSQYLEGTTVYTAHGDWFAWGCLICGLIAALSALL
jgi:hypothetical protein